MGGLNEWKGTVWQLQKNVANETCIITISIARNVKKGPLINKKPKRRHLHSTPSQHKAPLCFSSATRNQSLGTAELFEGALPSQPPPPNKLLTKLHCALSAETNKDQQVQTWRLDSPLRFFPPKTGIPKPGWVGTRAGSPGLSLSPWWQVNRRASLCKAAAAPGASATALAGISILLIAHQRAVVMQDLHGMFPVPASATEILEADLGVGEREKEVREERVGSTTMVHSVMQFVQGLTSHITTAALEYLC